MGRAPTSRHSDMLVGMGYMVFYDDSLQILSLRGNHLTKTPAIYKPKPMLYTVVCYCDCISGICIRTWCYCRFLFMTSMNVKPSVLFCRALDTLYSYSSKTWMSCASTMRVVHILFIYSHTLLLHTLCCECIAMDGGSWDAARFTQIVQNPVLPMKHLWMNVLSCRHISQGRRTSFKVDTYTAVAYPLL